VRSSVTKWALFNVVEKDELDTVRPSFPGAVAGTSVQVSISR